MGLKRIAAVALLAVVAAGCSSADNGGALEGSPPPQSPVTGGDAVVKMTDSLKFEPASITVAAGTEVLFDNPERLPHTVSAIDGSFESGTVNGGGEYSRTFDKPGTFKYFCKIHGRAMSGEVVVTG